MPPVYNKNIKANIKLIKKILLYFMKLAKNDKISNLCRWIALYLLFVFLNVKRNKVIKKELAGNRLREIRLFNGSTFIIDLEDSGLSTDLFFYNKREPNSVDYLTPRLKAGDIFYDIGANIGYYSILVSKIVNFIVAIEPYKLNYELLVKNTIANSINNIKFYNMALGETASERELIITSQRNWVSIFDESIKTDFSAMKKEKVSVCALDDFLEQNPELPPPTWMKMDVEGYEYFIIKGALKTLKKWHPSILMELHSIILKEDKAKYILRTFLDLGYEIDKVIFDYPVQWYCAPPYLKKAIEALLHPIQAYLIGKGAIVLKDLINNKRIFTDIGLSFQLSLRYNDDLGA